MVWRIWFIIFALFVMWMNHWDANDYTKISNLEVLIGILITAGFMFVLGLFYSLGWKQKILTKKLIYTFSTIIIIDMLLFLITCALGAYPIIYAQTQDPFSALIGCLVGSLTVTVMANLFLIPLYIGLYKYNKNFDSLVSVKKPCWKLFSLIFATILADTFIGDLGRFTHFALYNFFDFFVIFSSIYEIAYIIGFSWDIKIINKLFWQITAIPYMILSCMAIFFVSDAYNQDTHIKELFFDNYVIMAFTIIIGIAFLYMIYQYAYSKKELSDNQS